LSIPTSIWILFVSGFFSTVLGPETDGAEVVEPPVPRRPD
jgi:hypothetical protein